MEIKGEKRVWIEGREEGRRDVDIEGVGDGRGTKTMDGFKGERIGIEIVG